MASAPASEAAAAASAPSPAAPRGLAGGYRPELDVLRLFAFLAVFLTHALPREVSDYARWHVPRTAAIALATVASAGANGVTLFFCLSSYLITTLLTLEISARGAPDVRAFYLRRVLRIWPLYLVFTAFAAMLPLVDHQQRFGGRALAAFLLFSGNWVFALGWPIKTVATPLWSVSVEEQFYIVWPWMVRRSSPRTIRRLALVLVAVGITCRFVLRMGWWRTDPWHNTLAMLDPIALGAFIAVLPRGCPAPPRGVARGAIILGTVVAILAVTWRFALGENVTARWSYDLAYPIISIACAVLLWATIGAAIDRDKPWWRTMIYLGKISYGLYVFHNACLYLVGRLWLVWRPSMPAAIGIAARLGAALSLTVALAACSYRWLERPFLRLKSRLAHVQSRAA